MKESGIGRENGVEALMACKCSETLIRARFSDISKDSQSKSTIVNIATAEETRINDDWFAEDAAGKRYG